MLLPLFSNTPSLPSLSELFSQLIVYGLFSQLIVYFIRITRIEGTIYDMSKEIILTRIGDSCPPYLFLGSKNKTKDMNICEMKF